MAQDSYGEAESQKIKWGGGKEQYPVEVSIYLQALEGLDTEGDINSAWEYQNVSQRESRFLWIEEA
jgi:hypothetical protein